MVETMARAEPILPLLTEWSAAKEDQHRLAKLGAKTMPMYRQALNAEARAIEGISRTVPRSIHGPTATLDFCDDAFASTAAALSNELGLRALHQMAGAEE